MYTRLSYKILTVRETASCTIAWIFPFHFCLFCPIMQSKHPVICRILLSKNSFGIAASSANRISFASFLVANPFRTGNSRLKPILKTQNVSFWKKNAQKLAFRSGNTSMKRIWGIVKMRGNCLLWADVVYPLATAAALGCRSIALQTIKRQIHRTISNKNYRFPHGYHWHL